MDIETFTQIQTTTASKQYLLAVQTHNFDVVRRIHCSNGSFICKSRTILQQKVRAFFFVSSRDLRFQLIAAFPYKVDHFQQKHEASLLRFLQNVKSFTYESRLKSLTKPKCVKLSDYTCSYLRLDERKMSTSIAKKLQYNGNNSLKRGLRVLSVAFTN